MTVLYSTCSGCREIIAKLGPDDPWRPGSDHPLLACRPHYPLLIWHDGCPVEHAAENAARLCAQDLEQAA